MDFAVLEADVAGLKGDAFLFRVVSLSDLLFELANIARLEVAERARSVRGQVQLDFLISSSFSVLDLFTCMANRILGRAQRHIINRNVVSVDAFFERHMMALPVLDDARHV